MNESWIKVYRKIEEWRFYKKPAYSHLWQHLIRKAQFKDRHNINGQLVKRGQVDFSLRQLASETGIPIGTVRNILKSLEIDTAIYTVHEGKNSKDLSIISITNYEKYQETKDDLAQSFEHSVNSECTVSKHSVNNFKKEKKEKKDKKEKNSITDTLDIHQVPAQKGTIANPNDGFDLHHLIDIYPAHKSPTANHRELTKVIKSQEDYDLAVRGIENYKLVAADIPRRFITHMKTFIKDRLWEQYAEDSEASAMAETKKFLDECIARQDAMNEGDL